MKKIAILAVLITVLCAFLGCTPVKTDYRGRVDYIGDVYVELGQFPRSEVDGDAARALERAYNENALQKNGDYYSLGGADYARVKIKNPYLKSDPERTDADFERFTGYKLGTVHWFKVEPIVWRVLNTQNGYAVLASEELIFASPYTSDETGENEGYLWENSDLRAYLNNDFYEKAFSDDEKKLIKQCETECCYISNPSRLKYTRTRVTDRVRVLSWREARLPGNFADDKARLCAMTDYAAACGGARVSETAVLNAGKNPADYAEFMGCGIYWLLDTESDSSNVYIVYEFGNTLSYSPFCGNRGVRAVITVPKQKIKERP